MVTSKRGSINYEAERTLRTIFKRCVQCPSTPPTCPSCSGGEICSLVPQDCNNCAYATCIRNPNPPPASPGPNVGAIAGGVIGGIVVVAVIVFFVWRFWIKKRREQQELEAEEWDADEVGQQKAMHRFHNSDALSTRTRGSVANSFLSRASNIIQIAYFPGVTTRNGSGRDSLLATSPVPPIPATVRGSQAARTPLRNEGDALFFRPGDLRDSTYSAASSFRSHNNNRDTQYTMKSITPSLARSSMASEIYRDDATSEPMPATTVIRAAPRMVSVKSSAATTPAESIAPSIASSSNFQVMIPGEGQGMTPASSVRGKATQVTVGGKGKGRFPVRSPSDGSAVDKHAPSVSSPLADGTASSDEEDDHARARKSYTGAAQPSESPFFDTSENSQATSSVANEAQAKRAGKGMGGLSAVIEEATRRASYHPGQNDGKRGASPFDDTHEIE